MKTTVFLLGVIVSLLGVYFLYSAYTPENSRKQTSNIAKAERQKADTIHWVSPGQNVVAIYQHSPPQPFYLWVGNEKVLALQEQSTFIARLKPNIPEPTKIALELHPEAVVPKTTKKTGRKVETTEAADIKINVLSQIPSRLSWKRILAGVFGLLLGGILLFVWYQMPTPRPSQALVKYGQAQGRYTTTQQLGIWLMVIGFGGLLTLATQKDGWVIESVSKETGYGLRVTLAWEYDGMIWTAVYGHLWSTIFDDIPWSLYRRDIPVKAGTVLGTVDSTGFSTGNHLHIGLAQWKDGKKLNTNNGYGGNIDLWQYVKENYMEVFQVQNEKTLVIKNLDGKFIKIATGTDLYPYVSKLFGLEGKQFAVISPDKVNANLIGEAEAGIAFSL